MTTSRLIVVGDAAAPAPAAIVGIGMLAGASDIAAGVLTAPCDT
jgi:hypothetical protein